MMYDQNHSGISLDPAGTEAINIQNGGLLQGFLSKSDIESLLGQTDCVGLRVYNALAIPPDPGSCVIVVGVRENGSEMNGPGEKGYLLSQPFDPSFTSPSGTPEDRAAALLLTTIPLDSLPRNEVRYSSFFSKAMLSGLQTDFQGSPIAGVGFHKTQITTLSGTFFTHTGAPYLNSGGILEIAGNTATPALFLKSDKPCPGACAQLVNPPAVNLATDDTIESARPSFDSELYLLKW